MGKVYLRGHRKRNLLDYSYAEDFFWGNYWDAKNDLEENILSKAPADKEFWWIKKYEFDGDVQNNQLFVVFYQAKSMGKYPGRRMHRVLATKAQAEKIIKENAPSGFIEDFFTERMWFHETWKVI